MINYIYYIPILYLRFGKNLLISWLFLVKFVCCRNKSFKNHFYLKTEVPTYLYLVVFFLSCPQLILLTNIRHLLDVTCVLINGKIKRLRFKFQWTMTIF